MKIREATISDFEAIWPIFHEIVSAGETYGFDPNSTKAQAKTLWMDLPQKHL